MARANEIGALAELAADAIDRFAITPAAELHAGIAGRVFAHVGAAATPTRLVHDRVSTYAYSATRAALATAAGAVAAALRRADGADVRPLSSSRSGRMFIGFLNGMAGDRLAQTGSELAIHMSVRHAGDDVPCTAGDIERVFPFATPKIAVFVHGLAGSEEWWARAGADAPEPPLGARLRDAAGYTPVYVRYNTGLHVSDNAAQLSSMLERLLSAWPLPVQTLALVGHSMGGLVIRGACDVGVRAQQTWPLVTRHVITLGTPHHGAPLAKAAHAAAWALEALPETRPLAHMLDTRSAGIHDLRLGTLHEEDWHGERSGDFADRRRRTPLLPQCDHTFVTATVTVDPRHPVGFALGDLLVRTESASGRSRSHVIPVDPGSIVHLGGLHHIDLLDHPAVAEALQRVLVRGSRGAGDCGGTRSGEPQRARTASRRTPSGDRPPFA